MKWIILLLSLIAQSFAGSVVIIGDSLIVGSEGFLRQFLADYDYVIDAKVGRHFKEGMELIKAYDGAKVYLINLFNNSRVDYEELEYVVRFAKSRDAKVIFVTTHVPRAWRNINNQNLRLISSVYDNVYLVNWDTVLEVVCQDRPCISSDGVHLKKEGSFYYALAIFLKLREALQP